MHLIKMTRGTDAWKAMIKKKKKNNCKSSVYSFIKFEQMYPQTVLVKKGDLHEANRHNFSLASLPKF